MGGRNTQLEPDLHAGLQNSLTERYTRSTWQETLAELLCSQEQGLVGAVGIEPTILRLTRTPLYD
jgi:hypothetical protein